MNIVAMDGAFGGLSVAVIRSGEVIAHRRIDGATALEDGLPLVLETMRQGALLPAEVDALAVGTGPGGFTGLRIAISYAKSLALGWRRPLTGVNSFDAMCYGLDPAPALAVISAKAGTASARLTIGLATHRFSGSSAVVCDRVVELWPGGELRVVGAPEDVRSGLGERGILVHTIPMLHPPSVAIAQIAATRPHESSPHAVRADYGEAPPAKVPQAG